MQPVSAVRCCFSRHTRLPITASDSASLTFTWLDSSPPSPPKVGMQDVRTISIDGGSDSGSGLARYELRFAGHVHTFPPGDASSFVFRRGLAGTANVTALDNAGNRSDPAHVTVSRNGPVRVVR